MRILLIAFLLISATTFSQKKKKQKMEPLVVADSLFVAGNYQAAIPMYTSGLKKPQTTPDALPWYRLGVSYHRINDYTKALEAYRKAEKINPKLPGLSLNMSKAYSVTGDVASSIVVLDSAISRGFGNYKVLETDPDFSNLRKSEQYSALRQRAYNASHPCETLAAARAFDFWLGEWEVYTTANLGVKAGRSTITRKSGGCVILESWESQGPHDGVSINYFDPAVGKWKQKWAGSGQDIIEFYDGEYTDRIMRFKFDITNPDGTVSPGKLEFTNMENGNVRQHSQNSVDGGKTWQTEYDFTYVRKR